MKNFKLPLLFSVIWLGLLYFFHFTLVTRIPFFHDLYNTLIIVIMFATLLSIVFIPVLVVMSIVFCIKSFKERNYMWGIINLLLPLVIVFVSFIVFGHGSGSFGWS